MPKTIYANALLSDGKILFWYTGSKCDEFSFYKDFYYSGINELEYTKNHKIECKSIGFIDETENEDYNHLCFEVLAIEFYKQWEISTDCKGRKPYGGSIKVKVVENDCVDCGLPCFGDTCPHRNVTRYYCDKCGEEAQLYEFEGEELCIECIEKMLDKVE